MGWLQANFVMPVSVTNILQRLAASVFMLALLLLGVVHPASAHGTGHHHTASQNSGQLVMADYRSGTPDTGRRCDGCPDCCAIGQCSMASIALPSSPSVPMWLTRQSAIYGGYAARDAAGPGTAPATPPPKLDA